MFVPELSAVNPLDYPVEYFDAQVHFAKKWSEISDDDFTTVLLTKTALYRRITGTPAAPDSIAAEWINLISEINPTVDPNTVTQQLYAAFAGKPHGVYRQPRDKSALGYDFDPTRQMVKIHFTNPKHGEKPLADINMAARRKEFRVLLERVKAEHPEAALLMSATWLRSTAHYQSLSPPDIAPQKNLMTPDMKLNGNSVWGQFIDASGNVNHRVYAQFINGIANAANFTDLVQVFPYKTLLAVDPIGTYYTHYGIENSYLQEL